MTFERAERALVLSNFDLAHSKGGLIAYTPQSNVLFTSDLLYLNSVGFLGADSLHDRTHVNGGPEDRTQLKNSWFRIGRHPSKSQPVSVYLKGFLSEMLKPIENGDSIEDAKNR